MKVRNGFVSNSSSASFIIYFGSDKDYNELKEMINKSHNLRKNTLFDQCKLNNEDEIYSLELGTGMFNDWTDVPGWKFVRALHEGKINNSRLYSILQTSSEDSIRNEQVEFDPYVYDSEQNTDLQSKKEVEYIKYLASIGYDDFDSEDIKKLIIS